MQPFDITEPLSSYIKRVSKTEPALAKSYGKVRKLLRVYATSKLTVLEKLTPLDLWTEGHDIHPDLLDFINRLPKPFGSTPERYEQYKKEKASRLRQILKLLPWHADGDEYGDIPPPMPVFLLPAWRILARVDDGNRRKSPPDESRDKYLKQFPLTERGRLFLKVMLHVVKQHSISTLEPLFVTHSDSLHAGVRELCHERLWNTLGADIGRVRRALGFEKPCVKKQSLTLEEFPPTLRRQCEEFMRVAPSGLTDHSLCSRAKHHDVNVGPLEAATVKCYINAIRQALVVIPFGDDLDVRDLLRVTPFERRDEDGNVDVEFHNPLIDLFRKQQSQLVTDRKRAGFDSSMFKNFTGAIKAVAAYNGLFHLHKNFNRGYRLRGDVDRKREVKDEKKKHFDLAWIDAEIARLGVEFDRIIKEKSFQITKDGKGVRRARASLALILFYVAFVTLRYMGYRQQSIRDCVIGENIIFKPDGSIIFQWEAKKVKNDRSIRAEINFERHAETHGVLLHVLNSYYRHVYPYLRRMNAKELGGQFFVALSRGGINVRPWNSSSAALFLSYFKWHSLRFLNYGGRLQKGIKAMHPHFLRGRCADWLIDVLGLSFAEAAEYLGDTEQTIRAEYVDRHRVLNATPALDAAAAKAKERKSAEGGQTWEDRFKALELEHKSELARRDAQIASLQQQVHLSQREIIGLLKNNGTEASIN